MPDKIFVPDSLPIQTKPSGYELLGTRAKFHVTKCSHLSGLLLMYKKQMGLVNCVHSRRRSYSLGVHIRSSYCIHVIYS